MEASKEIKRFDDSNVNPDLAAERSKCTFDIEFMTNLVDGSPYLTDIKRKAGGSSFSIILTCTYAWFIRISSCNE